MVSFSSLIWPRDFGRAKSERRERARAPGSLGCAFSAHFGDVGAVSALPTDPEVFVRPEELQDDVEVRKYGLKGLGSI